MIKKANVRMRFKGGKSSQRKGWLLQFDEEYFRSLKYFRKERLIKRFVLESLKWGSKVSHIDLLEGKGRSALDVGCAFGYGVSLFNSLDYDALGTDISPYSLRQAKKKISKNDFVVCDVQENLPFKKKFDLITCFEVLEHLKNPVRALQNMYNTCDGVILCTTPNKPIERIVKKVMKDFDKTHVNVKTPLEWEKQLCRIFNYSFIKIECFVDLSFQIDNTLFFKPLKLPFGMTTRMLIKK